ncbi:MAG: hypothetical protein V7K94_18720 [Nostoc sp.]|uniref:hypothetical protein n=1 Tax=Nostoc sp. TaxID=1180 RepID=UPI002FFC8924
MLTYQLEGCIAGEGTAGSLSPPRRRRAVSLRPIAGTYFVAAANPKTGIFPYQKAHLEKLSTYKDLEQRYFKNLQELLEAVKFQYLTLLNGISYETHWLAWCNQVIELLNQTVKKL